MKQIQVLIVDDDANSLRLSLQAMQQLVEPAGIFTASNASETLQILQTCRIPAAFPLRTTSASTSRIQNMCS